MGAAGTYAGWPVLPMQTYSLEWLLVGGVAYALLSMLCFVLYARDKAAARAGRRRTPESTLLWLGLAGGWPGGWLAQRWLRHKTAKPAFLWRFRLSVAVNVLALGWLVLRPVLANRW